MRHRPRAFSLSTVPRLPAFLVIATAALALSACGSADSDDSGSSSLTAARVAVSERSASPSNDLERTLDRYAKCLREHGLDVPDPDFSRGYFGVDGYPFSDLDRNDPQVGEAIYLCQRVFIDSDLGWPGSGSTSGGS